MGTNDISILAIESSCDETSASIIVNGKVLNNIVATQSVHEKYGGVVPELASRAHQENLIPVIHEAISTSGITKEQLSAVAFTRGPGLMGSLLVGVSFAKAFARALNIPLIDINHMQAHVLAHFIEDPKPSFPFICLTVSGGHTQLVLVKDYLDMEVIGETQDDAVGEAFDKTAKLLGLPYPGGPLVDKYAKEGKLKQVPFTQRAEMQKLGQNLGALNNVYELQLKSSQDYLESMTQMSNLQENIKGIMADLAASAKDTASYRENMAMLSQNLTDLNNVYGNMLRAMRG